MSNFTPAWIKKGFFNESLFCDDFLSTHQLLYSNGAFFTPDGRMVDPMPLRCEIFDMLRDHIGANIAKRVSTVDTLGSPMGGITTALALLEQEAGGAGAYGFARGATAILPENLLPAATS